VGEVLWLDEARRGHEMLEGARTGAARLSSNTRLMPKALSQLHSFPFHIYATKI
jgi:hypothetical protein